jgi:phage shock protein A
MAFVGDFFGRIGRVVRGQANSGVDALEDATFEATVRQTVADMRTDLNNVVRASASAMSNYNRLDAEYQKYARQSEEWKGRANMALDAGNEDLARKALAKKAECDQQVASMKTAVDSARATSEKLKAQVGELKRKIEEGERTAGTLVARKNAAVAQRKVSEAMAGVGNADNAFAQLNRFEQTVAKEEATAQAFDQLANTGTDNDLEKEFAKLGTHGVDDQLAALKAERSKGALAPPYIAKELPGPGGSVSASSAASDKTSA